MTNAVLFEALIRLIAIRLWLSESGRPRDEFVSQFNDVVSLLEKNHGEDLSQFRCVSKSLEITGMTERSSCDRDSLSERVQGLINYIKTAISKVQSE